MYPTNISIRLWAGMCLMCFAFQGCAPSTTDSPAGKATKKLPKLTFHKPKEYSSAVARLGELISAINSDAALPEPVRFDVEEIMHGTGSSAHSHYYLVYKHEHKHKHKHKHKHEHEHEHEHEHQHGQESDHEHDHEDEHEHGHQETGRKLHTVKVDVITELTDIVRWLPSIAGNGDMDETNWAQVKSVSESFGELLESATAEQSVEEIRNRIREKKAAIDGYLKQLTACIKAQNPDSE